MGIFKRIADRLTYAHKFVPLRYPRIQLLRSFFHWQLNTRGIFLQEGPHKSIIRSLRVRNFMKAVAEGAETERFEPDGETTCLKSDDTVENGAFVYALSQICAANLAGPELLRQLIADCVERLWRARYTFDILEALGVLAVVDKRREIYFLDNVKFHIDRVAGLGRFVEIEAIDATGEIGRQRLRAQCEEYVKLLGIQPEDLVACSYSDMLIERETPAQGERRG